MRLLAAATRFGLGLTCSSSGFLLIASPGALFDMVRSCSSRALVGDAAPQCRHSLRGRGKAGAISCGVAFCHPLCMGAERRREVRVPRIEPTLSPGLESVIVHFAFIAGPRLASDASSSRLGRDGPARPKHVAVPSNLAAAHRGYNPSLVADVSRLTALAPRRSTAPPNSAPCARGATLRVHAQVLHVVGFSDAALSSPCLHGSLWSTLLVNSKRPAIALHAIARLASGNVDPMPEQALAGEVQPRWRAPPRLDMSASGSILSRFPTAPTSALSVAGTRSAPAKLREARTR